MTNWILMVARDLGEIPGPPFEIIPRGRGKSDVAAYKFFRWYGRRHKEELYALMVQELKKAYLYGSTE